MSWDDFCYGVWDFFSTSTAEAKRNQYRDLVNKLEGKIDSLSTDLSQTQTDINRLYSAYENQGGSNEGQFCTVFSQKIASNRESVQSILNTMNAAIENLRSKLQQARDKQAYWQEIVDQEDRDREEYKEG